MYPLLAALAGLLVGSFLNVCIFRLPRRESVIHPRSRCPKCGHSIRAWENVPVVSYLLLGGKCSKCKTPISWVYPLVEILTALLFFLLFLKFEFSPAFLVNALFFCGLVVLVFVDLHERILPDVVTLGGAGVGLALSPWQAPELLAAVDWQWKLLASLLGGVLGGGVLWLVAAAYLKLRKIEGMGFGDVKMMLMVGTFLGWRLTWLTVFLGSVLGSLIGGLFMVLTRKGRRYELPFGSFLGFGALIATLWGRQILAVLFG